MKSLRLPWVIDPHDENDERMYIAIIAYFMLFGSPPYFFLHGAWATIASWIAVLAAWGLLPAVRALAYRKGWVRDRNLWTGV